MSTCMGCGHAPHLGRCKDDLVECACKNGLEPPSYSIEDGQLIEHLDRCTCGFPGGAGYCGAHLPECGLEPLGPIDQILADVKAYNLLRTTGLNYEPQCNGICLTGSDIGVPSSSVAYPHPDCEKHGELGYVGRHRGMGDWEEPELQGAECTCGKPTWAGGLLDNDCPVHGPPF